MTNFKSISNFTLRFGGQISNLLIRLFAYSFVAFTYLVICLLPVSAQSSSTLTITPPLQSLSAKPGEQVRANIRVRNESADPLLLAAQARDFIVVDVKGTPKMVEEQTAGRWSLASWIVVSPTDFVLQPKTSRNVDVVIMVPENALPGGHYASVYFAPQVGPLAGGAAGTVASGSSIEPRLGGLISLRVAGPVTEEAFLRRLEIPRFSEYGPIKITTEIENIGEVHVQPKGKIEIKDFLGNVLQSFNLEERNIFPYTSRIYENTWGKKMLLGRFQALLTAGYGQTGQALTGVVYFWVIPYKIIAAVVLALAIIALIFFLLGKKSRES